MQQSASDESVVALAVEHREISEKLTHLAEAIEGMDGPSRLQPVDAALLVKYEHSRASLEIERGTIERELREMDRHSVNDVMIAVIPDDILKHV